ncbi:MAG TPA: branched-chain amino acid ABC transporter permease [Mycobacteriales bacterium]|nr:branched-chain amino acid ABC transporter permease [Mycobacteriales bacterium]
MAFDYNGEVFTPLVSGAIQGSIYGLLGLGLVLLYKGNRIFNFVQGEFGSVSAFMASAVLAGSGFLPKLPYGAAIAVGLVAGTAMGLLTERLVIRPLFRQPKVTLVVATVGVALLAIAFELILTGTNGRALGPISDGKIFQTGGLLVTRQQGIIVAVLIVLAVASAAFFKLTQTGTAILAVSQEPTATSLVGISVNRISSLTWGMAGFLGAVAGLLLAGQNAVFLPGFVTTAALIPAFTAAVFGGITSLPGVFLGGVVIGVIEQFGNSLNFLAELTPGANRVIVFITLLTVLLIKPAGLLGKEA